MGYGVGQERGADTALLIYIYMHRSSGQKGNQCVGYGSAAKLASSHLNIIQVCALRICLGAMKTTPVYA